LIGEEITDPLYFSLLAYNFISGVYIDSRVDAILGVVEACSFFGVALGIVLTQRQFFVHLVS
jgi:hypothetical protein